MFSHYFKYLLESFQFVFTVIVRSLKILFRWRKEIELLRLDFATEHLFDSSLIVINYRFKNALFYRFGKHLTLEKQIKIFNLKNFESEFDLIVYGFFRTKTYKLKFEPQWQLNNSSFKASFSNLHLKLEQQPIPKLGRPVICLKMDKTIIKTPKIEILQKIIKLKTSTYNQNEFI